jgi:hypothetical protein
MILSNPKWPDFALCYGLVSQYYLPLFKVFYETYSRNRCRLFPAHELSGDIFYRGLVLSFCPPLAVQSTTRIFQASAILLVYEHGDQAIKPGNSRLAQIHFTNIATRFHPSEYATKARLPLCIAHIKRGYLSLFALNLADGSCR